MKATVKVIYFFFQLMCNIKYYTFCRQINMISIWIYLLIYISSLALRAGSCFFMCFGFVFRRPEVGTFLDIYNLKRGFLFAEY